MKVWRRWMRGGFIPGALFLAIAETADRSVASHSTGGRCCDVRSRGQDSVAWRGAPDPKNRAWRLGVGPTLRFAPTSIGEALPAPVNLEELGILSWNVHGRAGDLDALIADLRSGTIGARPHAHFVLLLQEVVRDGAAVPEPFPDGASGARPLPVPAGVTGRPAIEAVARRHGLFLVYVPSMRNGALRDPPEDRGNAMLATVPLEEVEALELPFEKQRRVAIAARMLTRSSNDSTGPVDTVQLVTAHFDARSQWRRVLRSFGAGRDAQAQTLTTLLAGAGPVILGGDLNTWFRGANEAAYARIASVLPNARSLSSRGTVPVAGPWPDLRLDHLFARLPADFELVSSVVPRLYGSDHFPVFGRVRVHPLGVPRRP